MRGNYSSSLENITTSKDNIPPNIESNYTNDSKIFLNENLKYSIPLDTNNPESDSNKNEPRFKNNSWVDNKITFGRRKQKFNPYDKNVLIKHENYSKNEKASVMTMTPSKLHMQFRYGNFHQYYGYRNQGTPDSRLLCMKKEWFYGKNILDIGCNAGHFTLSIARDFEPKCMIGIDIDNELVKMARKNVRHYINYNCLTDDDFPLSLPLSYGPIAQALDPKFRYTTGNFPFNVQFVQGNYIFSSDELAKCQEPFFDTILCLSLTKWIHLNWGDDGVKRLFHRAFAHLHPGGSLILEAQSFQSYSKRRKITEETYKHFKEIQFFPEMFNEYLIKEVGFQSCELIDTPAHSSKGFSRPIYLFLKASDVESCKEKKPKHVIYKSDSENSCNYSDIEQFSD